eukprot:g932.t1
MSVLKSADGVTVLMAAGAFAFGAAVGTQSGTTAGAVATAGVACVSYAAGFYAGRGSVKGGRGTSADNPAKRTITSITDTKSDEKDSVTLNKDGEGSSVLRELFETKIFGPLVLSLLVFAVAVISYSNCLPGVWIYDDWEAIVFNNDVTSVARKDGNLLQRCVDAIFSRDIWRHDFWGQPLTSDRSHKSWRPVTTITYRIQAALLLAKDHLTFSPDDATWIRGLNVLLHAMCAAMITTWLWRTVRAHPLLAGLAGILFAVHPVHTEVVNCGVGRAEILSALFFMSCLCAHAEGLRAFLAMLSKEIGITALGVCAVQDLCLTRVTWLATDCRVKGSEKDGARRSEKSQADSPKDVSFFAAMFRAAYLAIFRCSSTREAVESDMFVLISMWRRVTAMVFAGAASLTVRFAVMGWATPGSVTAFSQFDNHLAHTKEWENRVMTGWYLAGRHMSLLFWPLQPLCHDWSLSSIPIVRDVHDPRNALSVAFLASLLIFAAFVVFRVLGTSKTTSVRQASLGTQTSIVCLGGTMLLLPFLPASNLLFWVGFVIAERVMYLPSVGACILIACAVCQIWGGAMTRDRKISTTTTASASASAVVRRALALVIATCLIFSCAIHTRRRNEAWKSAELLHKEDMAVNPRNAKIPYGLARVYINRNRYAEAEDALLRSLRIEPKFGDALAWLGRVYFRMSAANPEDARREHFVDMGLHMLRLACENSPDNFDAHVVLADYLARSDALGQTLLHESARAALRAAEIRPYSPRPLLVLARIRVRQGDFHGAESFLRPIVRAHFHEGEDAAVDADSFGDEEFLFHREATPEALYLYGILKAAQEDMPAATRSYARATMMGHERSRIILSALEDGESSEIMEEAKTALLAWSKQTRASPTRARFESGDYALSQRGGGVEDSLTGPGDHWEHVSVFVTADDECEVRPPLNAYYAKSEDIILRKCRQRMVEGYEGPQTRAHDVFGRLMTIAVFGTSESGTPRPDYGYWMDHRLRMSVEVDDVFYQILFGLVDNPYAVASISCSMFASQIDSDVCIAAIAQRVANEQATERRNRAERGGGWRVVGEQEKMSEVEANITDEEMMMKCANVMRHDEKCHVLADLLERSAKKEKEEISVLDAAEALRSALQIFRERTDICDVVLHRWFVGHICQSNVIAAAASTDRPSAVIGSFHAAKDCFGARNKKKEKKSAARKSFRYASLFAGQGSGSAYFDELKSTIVAFPRCKHYVEDMLSTVREEFESLKENEKDLAASLFPKGYEPHQWLSIVDDTMLPNSSYLASVPVSYALVGICQLTNYCAAALYAISDSSAGNDDDDAFLDANTRMSVSAGHSQGVMAAVAVAMSRDRASFRSACRRVIRCLFWCGVRVQQSHNEEGRGGGMLAVRGLTLTQVETFLDVAQQLLRRNDQEKDENLCIALVNGPRACVVAGSSKALAILDTLFRPVPISNEKSASRRRTRRVPTDLLPETLRIAPNGTDQSRVPFSKRRLAAEDIFVKLLPISAQFHCRVRSNVRALDRISKDMDRLGLTICTSELLVPVLSTDTGRTLSAGEDSIQPRDSKIDEGDFDDKGKNLVPTLLRLQLVDPVDWRRVIGAVSESASIALSFGPSVGFSRMTSEAITGRGTRIVYCAVVSMRRSIALPHRNVSNSYASLSMASILNSNECDLAAPDWEREFAVRRSVSSTSRLENRWTRELRMPPIMLAGMTPTTSLRGIDLVAAAANAGFWAELAGGGLPRPQIFRRAVVALSKKLRPGVGFYVNLLYLNAKQWRFQFPLTCALRREGFPILGITIGAGVPSHDRAMDILKHLSSAGISQISFKPGSISAIRSVVSIARASPSSKHIFIIQWTGGRGGGHHSFEDMHDPLFRCYGEIRKLSNVLLVAGSGIGNGKSALPYLTGEWSSTYASPHAWPRMPFDAVLIASRAMVAKEASTAPEVKQLIVDAPGLTEQQHLWEATYNGEAGGVLTVRSELGEPIHNIANRATRLWRNFDRRFFRASGKSKTERTAAILKHKASIVAALNSDFQKRYFGRKRDGTTADLHEMTYAEVLERLVDLVRAPNRNGVGCRWLDQTYASMVMRFVERMCERFDVDRIEDADTMRRNVREGPENFVPEFIRHRAPAAERQLMLLEDVDFFVNDVCRSGKPVPFVPVVDENLEQWFKKDSLWYSEDLAAVENRDPQRVVVLHGPVAAAFSSQVDEPIADILGGIERDIVKELPLEARVKSSSVPPVSKVVVTCEADSFVDLRAKSDSGLDDDAWLASLVRSASEHGSPRWLVSLLSAQFVVESSKRWTLNPIRALLCTSNVGWRARIGGGALTLLNDCGETVLHVRRVQKNDADVSGDTTKTEECDTNVHVEAIISYAGGVSSKVEKITHRFNVHDGDHYMPVLRQHRIEDESSVKMFYAKVWGVEDLLASSVALDKTVRRCHRSSFVVSSAHIERFARAVGHPYVGVAAPAPMDFCIVAAWRPIASCLLCPEMPSMITLVHLSNEYMWTKSAALWRQRRPIVAGDTLSTEARIVEIENVAGSGKRVVVEAMLSRVDETSTIFRVRSSFLFRGEFRDAKDAFREGPLAVVENGSERGRVGFALSMRSEIAILRQKEWFSEASAIETSADLSPLEKARERGAFLSFDCVRIEQTIEKCVVRGDVLAAYGAGEGTQVVGRIDFVGTCDAVTPYLRRAIARVSKIGDAGLNETVIFADGGRYLLEKPHVSVAPNDCTAYSIASGDRNPIHSTLLGGASVQLLANLGGHPIVHGMWTFASARGALETYIAKIASCPRENAQQRLSSFSASFQAMVSPGARLLTQLKHIGMRDGGSKLVEVETVDAASGTIVLKALGEICPLRTVHVFTGQGSASVAMGMDLYASSKIARDIWDRANAHLQRKFGFSILQIVRENPATLKLHFGGRRGEAVKQNYLNLRCRAPNATKDGDDVPLIPEIKPHSEHFSFVFPKGLLYATQFTQPALVLLELARYREMQAACIVPADMRFAGHSLGEYAAISAISDVLPIESLVELVFVRGLVMQRAVPRDAHGRSEYGMMAASPNRVNDPDFDESALVKIVDMVSRECDGRLLQLVNYNVEGSQYVVAGHLVCLQALGDVLSNLATAKTADINALVQSVAKTSIDAFDRYKSGHDAEFELQRGKATIPLQGIDVPFHSRYLLGGVPIFRLKLRNHLPRSRMTIERLSKLLFRYIPNVIAKPFDVSRAYVTEVFELTKSEDLKILLDKRNSETSWRTMEIAVKDNVTATIERRQRRNASRNVDDLEFGLDVAHTLLIELLAYQFASPVRWIETQRELLVPDETDASRFVEIGPSATLMTMAKRTLALKQFEHARRGWKLYATSSSSDTDALYFRNADRRDDDETYLSARDFALDALRKEESKKNPADDDSAEEADVATAVIPERAPNTAEPTTIVLPAPTVTAPPISATDIVRAVIASKLTSSSGGFLEIQKTSTIEQLVGGKSALQNEIVGDLSAEFGCDVPDEASSMTVEELGRSLAPSISRRPSAATRLGTTTSATIASVLRAKMPASFAVVSKVRSYIVKTHLMGRNDETARNVVDATLLMIMSAPPSKRVGSRSEAATHVDETVRAVARHFGMPFPFVSPAAPSQFATKSAVTAIDAVQPVTDCPVPFLTFLEALVASKLRSAAGDAASIAQKSLRDLCGGKSALQNEIVGDIGAELGTDDVPDVADAPLAEVAAMPFASGYTRLGKIGKSVVAKVVGGILPGGFSLPTLRRYLANDRCLGPGRIDAILLRCVSSLSKQKKTRFETGKAVKAWVDAEVDAYARAENVRIPRRGETMLNAALATGSPAAVDSAALQTVQESVHNLVRGQAEIMCRFLERNRRKERHHVRFAGTALATLDDASHSDDVSAARSAQDRLAIWEEEYGSKHERRITPAFRVSKVRSYSSSWNWAVQDALELYYLFANFGVDDRTGETKPDSTEAALRFFSSNANVAELNLRLTNKHSEHLMHVFKYFASRAETDGNVFIARGVRALHRVALTCLESHRSTTYNAQLEMTKPQVSFSSDKGVIYAEVPRFDSSENDTDTTNLYRYIDEMCKGANDAGADESTLPCSPRRRSTSFTDGDTSAMDAHICKSVESVRRKRLTSVHHRQANTKRDVDNFAYRSFLGKSAHSNDVHDQLRSFINKTGGRHDGRRARRLLEMPFLHIASPMRAIGAGHRPFLFDEKKTLEYFDCLRDLIEPGVSFAEKVALVTGCGKGSIASHIVRALLEGGATVVCTSSSAFRSVQKIALFRDLYTTWGGVGSKLYLSPLNGASAQDVRNIVSWIYGTLKLDVDFVIPFAAAPENGRGIDAIDPGVSEVCHRMMMTNVLRMLGEIKAQKVRIGSTCRPALAVLPLSPNHGAFGFDGLYAESKLGLEALLQKWHSEDWSDYISVVGCVIGWTRGTGLMDENNILAETIEKCGVRTFSSGEMAMNIVALLHPKMKSLAAAEPVWADFGGDFNKIDRLNELAKKIRKDVLERATIAKSIAIESRAEATVQRTSTKESASSQEKRALPSSNLFPALPNASNVSAELEGMVDLDTTSVIVGFGEIGPWGSSRTRWEMESFGTFSLEGSIELAWMLGLIRYHPRGKLDNGETYVGWIDAKDGSPVADVDVKRRYEDSMLKHTGIRVIDPESFGGYTGKTKRMLAQVAIDEDMAPVELSGEAEARSFKAQLGDKAEIWCEWGANEEPQWWMRLLRGAVVAVPRALHFNRFVAGQIPKGWNAKRLGVPPEIVDSVDPVTLYALVSTVEALVSAGVTDPYEFYKYVHVSQVGNTIGGGLGGSSALRGMFRGRVLQGEDCGDSKFEGQGDLLQETFINTMSAWINLLLLSSSGPIKTPVGACATAAESLAIGVETITTGAAKIVLIGGHDDFQEEGSYEFAQMKATIDTKKDADRGRFPKESSRPTTSSRDGFVESAGAGTQILMSASLALKMGVPIYGIVGLASTATDKQGRSIPAPGRGILTTARETTPVSEISRRRKETLLSLTYRRKQLRRALERVASDLAEDMADAGSDEELVAELRREARKSSRAVVKRWGNDFARSDDRISPLRGALAVWGLCADDILVSSFHGTSTAANDVNESAVAHIQMEKLGRTRGNPLMVVCQKYLTGHPKGAAAAWMVNGLLQAMISGIVPGNRNADDIDAKFEKFYHLFYPNKSIRVGSNRIKACLLQSFGFGQAGAQILLIHPNYVYAAAGMLRSTAESSKSIESLCQLAGYDHPSMEVYRKLRSKRECATFHHIQEVQMGLRPLVSVKTSPPYSKEDEEAVYMDPSTRASWDPNLRGWRIRPSLTSSAETKAAHPASRYVPEPTKDSISSIAAISKSKVTKLAAPPLPPVKTRLEVTLRRAAMSNLSSSKATSSTGRGVGVDVEPVHTFEGKSEAFLRRNFTDAEIAYARAAPSAASSFAGRWAAKEAVVKAMSSCSLETVPLWKGAGAPLKDIEIIRSSSGAPRVVLHGHAKKVAEVLGVGEIKVSISHTESVAVSQALVL